MREARRRKGGISREPNSRRNGSSSRPPEWEFKQAAGVSLESCRCWVVVEGAAGYGREAEGSRREAAGRDLGGSEAAANGVEAASLRGEAATWRRRGGGDGVRVLVFFRGRGTTTKHATNPALFLCASGSRRMRRRWRDRRPRCSELLLSVLSTILMATILTFGSFWAVAAVAQRREILYLGGLLSSCFLFIVWLLFASCIIGPSVAVFKVEPYLGLLIFMGLFVFDTHQTIKKAQLGEIDHISHALTLCTDFFAVLVTVVVVTVKDFQYRREERRRRMGRN